MPPRRPAQSLGPTPEQIKIHQIKARVAPLLDAGQHELAIELLEQTLPLDRRDAMLHKMLGAAYMGHQNTQKATIHLKRAADLGLDDPETLLSLASVYKDNGDTRAALRVVEVVLSRDPGEPKSSRFKAFLLRSMGESEKALAWIDAARERMGPHPDTTILRAELLTRFKRLDEAEADLRSILDEKAAQDHHRRDALFALGKLLDQVGRDDEAFEAIDKANHMYDPAQVISPEMFEARWTPEAIAAIPAAPETGHTTSDRPVFVVGMPRSGTTLTEQIIGAHPSATSVGESAALSELARDLKPADLTPELLASLVEQYLLRTAPPSPQNKKGHKNARTKKSPAASRVVDKMPENYYFLQIISRALPNAAIIHCTRDLRDVALSCYFQNFGTRLVWTRRLDTIAAQIRLYKAVMDLWSRTLDTAILESNYESLTSDPRPQVEAMLAHVGLPFDEACMAHHKQRSTVQTASVDQVRNPIYTSSQQRWKRYEKQLSPLIEAIGDSA